MLGLAFANLEQLCSRQDANQTQLQWDKPSCSTISSKWNCLTGVGNFVQGDVQEASKTFLATLTDEEAKELQGNWIQELVDDDSDHKAAITSAVESLDRKQPTEARQTWASADFPERLGPVPSHAPTPPPSEMSHSGARRVSDPFERLHTLLAWKRCAAL